MKLKQTKDKIIVIAVAWTLALSGSIFLSDGVLAATGACSQKASYNDPCMNVNQRKTPLSAGDFVSAVHACEGRDSLGAAAPRDYASNSESGSCSNAIASCFSKVIDTRVCTNDSALAVAAGTNNGEISGEDWDKTIDIVNKYTGGEDFNSNSGIRGDRQRLYEENIKATCEARGTATAVDTCMRGLKDVFSQCYASLGGSHAKVDEAALKKCTNDKSRAIATNQTECVAAGGKWDEKAIGPGLRCREDPNNPNNPNNPAANPGNTGTEGNGELSGTGDCGSARTNIIDCGKDGGINALGNVLKIVLFILTILIGIVAVGGIVYGAILYASASDNAGQVNQAKTIIRDVAIGLLLYGFMIAIINWLVPGGVIG